MKKVASPDVFICGPGRGKGEAGPLAPGGMAGTALDCTLGSPITARLSFIFQGADVNCGVGMSQSNYHYTGCHCQLPSNTSTRMLLLILICYVDLVSEGLNPSCAASGTSEIVSKCQTSPVWFCGWGLRAWPSFMALESLQGSGTRKAVPIRGIFSFICKLVRTVKLRMDGNQKYDLTEASGCLGYTFKFENYWSRNICHLGERSPTGNSFGSLLSYGSFFFKKLT